MRREEEKRGVRGRRVEKESENIEREDEAYVYM